MDPIAACIARAIVRFELSEKLVLVAVSGGVDSTVLLHAFAQASATHGLRLEVAHINHGLRGEASEHDQKAVESQAARLALPCHVRRVDVVAARQGHSNRTRPTQQEAARSLRYKELEAIAVHTGADRIAMAHHLDDQAETVLMRVLRGTSVDGMAGIPETSRAGRVVRPLLAASRADIEHYAATHALEWREDGSNEDDHYARNRLRRHAIPLLAASYNPQLIRTLGQLAVAHRENAEWIASLVDDEFRRRFRPHEENGLEIVKAGWGDLHEALANRLLARAFRELGAGRDLSRVHVARMLGFLCGDAGAHGGREIELPGGLRLQRMRESFRLYRSESESG